MKNRIISIALLIVCMFVLCGCNEKPFKAAKKWYVVEIVSGDQVFREGDVCGGVQLTKTSYLFEFFEDGTFKAVLDGKEVEGEFKKRFEIFKLKSYWEVVTNDGRQFVGRCEKDEEYEYKFILEGRYYTYVLVPQKN